MHAPCAHLVQCFVHHVIRPIVAVVLAFRVEDEEDDEDDDGKLNPFGCGPAALGIS